MKQYDYKRNAAGKILPINKDAKIRTILGIGDKAAPENEITRYQFFELVIRIS